MNIASLLRRQMRNPLLALAVLVLVATAVAVNATAFGALHALRWKALPYADADHLVDLRADLRKFGFSLGLTERLREAVAADTAHFAGVLGYTRVRADEDGRGWQLARVTPDFSPVLGVGAALGRSFAADDARTGADAVLVLSDAAWRSRFGADPGIVGRTLRFADRSYSVIGVMPRGFAFPDAATEAWRPYVMTDAERAQSESGNVGDLDIAARLAPGTTPAQAREALGAIFEHDTSVAALRNEAGLVANAFAWRDRYAASQWRALALFQLAALILLAVVLANLVNLHLDRLLARARELAIRRALGAGEGAILREIVGDLIPPVVAGLMLGLAATPFALGLAARYGLLPADLPQGADFGFAAIAAGCAVAVATLATALVAAFASRRAAQLSSRAGVAGLGRLRPAMLVAQVMLTTMLLGASGLLLRSAMRLIDTERGFDARGVVLTVVDPVGVTVAGKHYDPAQDEPRFRPTVESIRTAVAALPGVEHVAVATSAPFTGWETVSTVRSSGHPEELQARNYGVGPGYFATLAIPLVAGREFADADAGAASPVIVDERYRDRFLQNVDPLGAYVDMPTGADGEFRTARIVGVARTVKQRALDEAEDLPTVYQFNAAPLPVFWLATRVHGDAQAFAETLRQRVLDIVPGAHIGVNKPLSTLVDATLTDREALLGALGAFATITLALAGLGLAAVLSFAIRRRTAELGVRMALGATPARVRNLVMRQGGALIGIGAVLGVGGGIVLARLLADRLYAIAYTDATTWLVALAVVGTTALLACWLPAQRAATIHPIEALRSE